MTKKEHEELVASVARLALKIDLQIKKDEEFKIQMTEMLEIFQQGKGVVKFLKICAAIAVFVATVAVAAKEMYLFFKR